MLDHEATVSLNELLGDGGTLSRVLRSYESRREQLLMAQAVESSLRESTPLLVEAGTGTGKSLAYLVPAAQSGLRIVISTATKALGEQIMQRDVPTLRTMGLHPQVTLVKGLSNYVCMRRLDEHRRAMVAGAVRYDPAIDHVLRELDQVETGDRSDFTRVAEDSMLWRDITSSSDTRVGAKCRYYEQCFVTKMRRRAEQSQIIVTNHHLFCADLALRGTFAGAAALPDYDAVVFDEAHALEEVATEFFGVRITRARTETLVRDASRAFETSGFFVDPVRARAMGQLLASITAASLRVFTALPRASGNSSRAFLRADSLQGEMGEALATLRMHLKDLLAAFADFVGGGDALLSVARRTHALMDAIGVLIDPDRATHVGYTDAEAAGGGAIGASPVEIGLILQEKLWATRTAVVLTSATLASTGEENFAFIRERLGVPENAVSLQLPSPFDYGEQAALYVPRKIPEPRDEGFLDAAVKEIRTLVDITRGGAFVLCTSTRHMRAFAERLRGTWSYPTWMQGEAPKHALLKQFRTAGNGVLFATSSFWEGVDVPGRALRLVIIDKVPFDPPDDPVVSARIQRITQQGGEPFDAYQLPVAALALKQGFGRLIRTRQDAGIVAILDKRLVHRGYGRRLLDALPPAARCHSHDELRAFWQSVEQVTKTQGAPGGTA